MVIMYMSKITDYVKEKKEEWGELFDKIVALEDMQVSERRICRELKIGREKLRKIKISKGKLSSNEIRVPKSLSIPKKKKEPVFFVMDFETTPFLGIDGNPIIPRFGTIIRFDFTGEIYEKEYFEGKLGFMPLIERYLQGYYPVIYTHNLKFDENLFFRSLINDYQLVCKPIINNGATIQSVYEKMTNKTREEMKKEKQAKIKAYVKKYGREPREDKISVKTYKEQRLFEFRDSYRLLMASVSNLGKFVGLEKMEAEYNAEEITPEYIEYCFRDCEIVIRSLQKLFKFCNGYGLNLKQLPLTVSSLALKFFKFHNAEENAEGKIFQPYLPPDNEITKKWEEESFFGGRTEVFNFQRKEKNVFGYDINSMYPNAMINNDFPLPPYSIETFNEITNLNDPLIFGYEIELEENDFFPLIPERTKSGIIFKNGKKHCNVFRFELDYLMQNVDNKIKIISVYKCSDYGQPFNYLQEFYNRRKFSNDGMGHFYKILLNSSYGVFAKKIDRESVYLFPISMEVPQEFGDINELAMLEAYFSNSMSSSDIYDFRAPKKIWVERNTIIASQITAKARLFLTQEIKRVSEAFGRNSIIYCDTDSIFTDTNAESVLEIGKELGKWKLEKKGAEIQVLAPKEYVITLENGETMITAKGLKKMPDEGSLTKSDLIDYHSGIGFLSWSLTGKKSILNRELEGVEEKNLRKKSRNEFSKRIINPDFTTQPFCDETWEIIQNTESYQKILEANLRD